MLCRPIWRRQKLSRLGINLQLSILWWCEAVKYNDHPPPHRKMITVFGLTVCLLKIHDLLMMLLVFFCSLTNGGNNQHQPLLIGLLLMEKMLLHGRIMWSSFWHFMISKYYPKWIFVWLLKKSYLPGVFSVFPISFPLPIRWYSTSQIDILAMTQNIGSSPVPAGPSQKWYSELWELQLLLTMLQIIRKEWSEDI